MMSFKRHKDLPQIPQQWKNNIPFPLELGPQTPLLVPKYILSQNISLPTTQGPDQALTQPLFQGLQKK